MPEPEFITTDGGIVLPKPPDDPDELVSHRGYPVIADWTYSKCGEIFRQAAEESFKRGALERLYVAVDPGGGRVLSDEEKQKQEVRLKMIDELAVELIGGVPYGYEEYT